MRFVHVAAGAQEHSCPARSKTCGKHETRAGSLVKTLAAAFNRTVSHQWPSTYMGLDPLAVTDGAKTETETVSWLCGGGAAQ